MKKRLFASILALCVFLSANSGAIAMAAETNTESVTTHQHTDSCYRIEESCIHTHTEECFPPPEDNPDVASPSNAEELQPINCTHVCSEETGCIVKVLDCPYIMESTPPPPTYQRVRS